MSISAMNHVWVNSPSSGGRLVVLLALADHANDDWIAWPKLPALAKKSRLSERQVERVLKALEKDGEIEAPPLRQVGKDHPFRIRQNVGDGSSTPATGQPDTGDAANPTRASGPCIEPSEEPSNRTPSARESEIQEVWNTYLKATGKTKMELNDKRRKHINNALDVALADDQAGRLAKVKLAVIGLSVSPHHNGENDTKTPYLDIRYALRGIKDESDDERIEKMAALGAQTRLPTGGPAIDPVRVERRLEAIRANRSSGGSHEPQRAAQAVRELEAWGYRIVTIPQAPWARLERAEEAA